MNVRKDIYGMPETASEPMRKQAGGPFGAFLPTFSDLSRTVTDIGATGATYLLAAAMGLGGVTGYTLAKMTAHGKRDMDTARKSYENQRLRADMGYLSGKVKQEFDAQQRQQAPKPARVIA